MEMKQICKGVKLCTHQTDKFKTARLSFSFITSLGRHTSANSLVVHLLSATNSKYKTISEMNRKLASLYGATLSCNVSKCGDMQVLSLILTAIDDRFTFENERICKDCVELLCECVFRPNVSPDGFFAEDVNREKRLLIEKIEAEKDDKRAYAFSRLIEEMCSEEAYGLNKFGKIEEIEKLTEKELFTRWMRLIVNSPVQINYVGSADPQIIEEAVLPYFVSLQRKDILVVKTDFITSAHEENTIREKQNVKQGKLVIGWRAGMTYDRDNFPALKLMNMLFGGGTFSKLFTNVREKMSLCYYCSSQLIASKGLLVVQSGVETENTEKALIAIKNELEEIKKGNFSQETLRNAKLSYCDTLKSIYDNSGAIDSWMLSYSVDSVYYSPEKLCELINAVSKEEIIVAASLITLDTVYILEGEKEEE
ncbi:MAG: insulinase family protein [Clostridia bacterium]|nr:insulinase family protein [Clostridia bacterium]